MDAGNELRLLSTGLHTLASAIIGPEKVVGIRRTVSDLANDFDMYQLTGPGSSFYMHSSGSKGEGFRFSSSDEDIMLIYNDVRVIKSVSQCRLYDANTTLLVMETEQTNPGYVLLRLLSKTTNSDVIRSCVSYPTGTYLSSAKWRDEDPIIGPNQVIHGPCISGRIGTIEYDMARCIKSDMFPKAATSSIRRLYERKWPSSRVLHDIVTGGCHFVPIPAKLPHFQTLEWRLSFSTAERKLVHAMNYTQFLCYGLLKIFLKEAINVYEHIDELLCSYHLKTVVLWEIVEDPREWSPRSILVRFWKCFERLIRWVIEEYCPNFFIPENNVMMGKFNRTTKAALLHHLTSLYSEGYRCLLRCPSLLTPLSIIIDTPQIVRVMPSDEIKHFMDAKVWTDFYTIKECFKRVPACLSFDNVDLLIRIANRLPQFAETYQSNIECFGMQTWTFYLLCN